MAVSILDIGWYFLIFKFSPFPTDGDQLLVHPLVMNDDFKRFGFQHALGLFIDALICSLASSQRYQIPQTKINI
jgi:hypothetical protein